MVIVLAQSLFFDSQDSRFHLRILVPVIKNYLEAVSCKEYESHLIVLIAKHPVLEIKIAKKLEVVTIAMQVGGLMISHFFGIWRL